MEGEIPNFGSRFQVKRRSGKVAFSNDAGKYRWAQPAADEVLVEQQCVGLAGSPALHDDIVSGGPPKLPYATRFMVDGIASDELRTVEP
jgi:hypothetical protein